MLHFRNSEAILVAVDSNASGIASLDLASQQLIRQTVTDLLRNEPVERSSTKLGVVASVAQPLLSSIWDFEYDAAIIEFLLKFAETDIYNVSEGFARQSIEEDEFVDAIEELGWVCR